MTAKELKDYTDEELRNELKRRAVERRKDTPREIVYVEFEATIKKVDNILYTNFYGKGQHKYKAFSLWRYILEDWNLDRGHSTIESRGFELQPNTFKKNEAPQVGDRVKLRYRRTKCNESFDIWKTKIVEIVK